MTSRQALWQRVTMMGEELLVCAETSAAIHPREKNLTSCHTSQAQGSVSLDGDHPQVRNQSRWLSRERPVTVKTLRGQSNGSVMVRPPPVSRDGMWRDQLGQPTNARKAAPAGQMTRRWRPVTKSRAALDIAAGLCLDPDCFNEDRRRARGLYTRDPLPSSRLEDD